MVDVIWRNGNDSTEKEYEQECVGASETGVGGVVAVVFG